jgi:uncharacterized protein (DUF934 family)
MAFVIRQRQVVADKWQLLKPAKGEPVVLPASGDVIVPLAYWQAERASLIKRAGKLGVWLDGNEDPAAISNDLGSFVIVAVNFPAFGDGRGYSIGRLLRERYGYQGELRAIGVVARDHLFYMAACGFDSFLMREGEEPAEALTAFDDFSETQQAIVGRPEPLFRRRLNANATGK